jgi:hypothetical protein
MHDQLSSGKNSIHLYSEGAHHTVSSSTSVSKARSYAPVQCCCFAIVHATYTYCSYRLSYTCCERAALDSTAYFTPVLVSTSQQLSLQ